MHPFFLQAQFIISTWGETNVTRDNINCYNNSYATDYQIPSRLIKGPFMKKGTISKYVCMCLMKMLGGMGGNKEAKGDYNDAYRNVVEPSYKLYSVAL